MEKQISVEMSKEAFLSGFTRNCAMQGRIVTGNRQVNKEYRDAKFSGVQAKAHVLKLAEESGMDFEMIHAILVRKLQANDEAVWKKFGF